MYEIVQHFFLADDLFLGGHPRFGYIHFPMADVFYLGSHLTVILHLGKYGVLFHHALILIIITMLSSSGNSANEKDIE